MGKGKLQVALEGPVAAHWERVGAYCLGMEGVGKGHFEDLTHNSFGPLPHSLTNQVGALEALEALAGQ